MKHEEIVARLHAAHVEHTGVIQPVIDCGFCAMYAEWVAVLMDEARAAGVTEQLDRDALAVAEAEHRVRLSVWHYCEVSGQTAEENESNPYAVGLARGYRDIQHKLAPAIGKCAGTKFPDGTRCGEYGWHAKDCPEREPEPVVGGILDDVDGDLAEQEDIVRARARRGRDG